MIQDSRRVIMHDDELMKNTRQAHYRHILSLLEEEMLLFTRGGKEKEMKKRDEIKGMNS